MIEFVKLFLSHPVHNIITLSQQSAPALDNISEDDQVPPKLPMKRKSTLSSSLAAKYDETIGANLSQQGMQSRSAAEINTNQNNAEEEIYDTVGSSQNHNMLHPQPRERPRSLPPDSFETPMTVPIPAPRHKPMENHEVQPQGRPIPKPRPRTMILRTESADNLLRSKTLSAENLIKSNPALDRIRSGSEVGALSAPAVPLKRAQMYRSQERVSSNGDGKESKF